MPEIIGYAGSFFIAASLLMSNVFRLRVINFIGAVIFVFYAFLIKAQAVFFVNLFIAFVDLYYIYQLKTKKDVFKFLETAHDGGMLKYFLSYNARDIMFFFPRFMDEDLSGCRCFLIMRNLMPVGLFVFKKEEKGRVRILLDYITKDYRDLKNAGILFNSTQMAEEFRGCAELYAATDNRAHKKYLMKLGFVPAGNNANAFVKKI